MRVLLASLVLAGCSGLPPESIIPLRAGEVAGGLTFDVPVSGGAPAGLSIWGGVGAGRGVDVAFSADAPFSLIAELGAFGRGDRPFLPPGLSVRKTFENGISGGVGIASARTPIQSVPPHRGLTWLTVGPFASIGSGDIEAPIVARATVRSVYEVRVERQDSTAETRRGIAVYGIAAVGPLIRSDSGFVVPGVRVIVGGRPRGAFGVTAGPFVEGIEGTRPLSDR